MSHPKRTRDGADFSSPLGERIKSKIPPKAVELPDNLLTGTLKKNENERQNAQKAQNPQYRGL
jgi:hypothetical protein